MWELEYQNEGGRCFKLMTAAEGGSPGQELVTGEQYLSGTVRHIHLPHTRRGGHVLFWNVECFDGKETNHTFRRLQAPGFLGQTDPLVLARVNQTDEPMFGPLPFHGRLNIEIGLHECLSHAEFDRVCKVLGNVGNQVGRMFMTSATDTLNLAISSLFPAEEEFQRSFDLVVGNIERIGDFGVERHVSGTRVFLCGSDNFFSAHETRIKENRLHYRRKPKKNQRPGDESTGWRPVTRYAYVIYDIAVTDIRSDWRSIPRIDAALAELEDAYIQNAPRSVLEELLDKFSRLCLTSADLTPKHAREITNRARARLLQALDSEEEDLQADVTHAADTLESLARNAESIGGLSMGDYVNDTIWGLSKRMRSIRLKNGKLNWLLDSDAPPPPQAPPETAAPADAPTPPTPPSAKPDRTSPVPPDHFDFAYEFVRKWEGGYVNHPKDPGGPTNFGVTQKVYDGFRAEHGLPHDDVRNIAIDDVKAIFRRDYWNKVNANRLNSRLIALTLFDTAINMGFPRATRFAQRAVNALDEAENRPRVLVEDGVPGPRTTGELIGLFNAGKEADFLARYFAEREKRYQDLGAQDQYKDFLNGWLNRLDALRAICGQPKPGRQAESIEADFLMAKTPDFVEDMEVLVSSADGAAESLKKKPGSDLSEAAAALVADLMHARHDTGKREVVENVLSHQSLPEDVLMLVEDAGDMLKGMAAFPELDILATVSQEKKLHSATLRRLHAQSLIELGRFDDASHFLNALAESADTPPSERAEAKGLLGRVGKQMLVNALRSGQAPSPEIIEAFQHGAQNYEAEWQESGASYHGGNTLAMLALAERAGIGLPAAPAMSERAEEVRDAALPSGEEDAWSCATIMETYVAQRDWENAGIWLERFIEALPVPGTFEIRSTLRQLREIWNLDQLPESQPGRTLYETLHAVWLTTPGGGGKASTLKLESISTPMTEEILDRRTTKLEALLGGRMTRASDFIKKLSHVFDCVARIEDTTQTPIGTGFAASSRLFWPDQPERPVLVTNYHVMNSSGVPVERDLRCVKVSDAVAYFSTRDGQNRFRVGRLLWESYYGAHDCTIAELVLPSGSETPGAFPMLEKARSEPYNPKSIDGPKAIGYVTAPGHPAGRADIEFGFTNFQLLQVKTGAFPLAQGQGHRELLHYLAGTEGGSSGSPVIDLETFELVGIHHAKETTDIDAVASPESMRRPIIQLPPSMRKISTQGRSYVPRKRLRMEVNEGIWIGSIKEGVQTFRFGVAQCR